MTTVMMRPIDQLRMHSIERLKKAKQCSEKGNYNASKACSYQGIGYALLAISMKGEPDGNWNADQKNNSGATEDPNSADERAKAILSTLASAAVTSLATTPAETIRAGEIIAWRAWRIGGLFKRNFHLLSTNHDDVWHPEGITASEQPGIGDSFGIYALKTRKDLRTHFLYSSSNLVFGTVLLWGQVVEGEKGYRAEFARVLTLEEGGTPTKLQVLRKRYGLAENVN